ncbi:MAG: CBS domain-containing protein [Gammaproteobacteria bacterium]|nr:CBS domain-containing protein [Gammaproteobacteria bacterium]
MLVKDAMCTTVKTCSETDSIKEIATIMCFNKISGLPVVNEDNEIIGVVSEKDVLSSMFPDMQGVMDAGGQVDFEKMESDYSDVLHKKVGEIMTRAVASVTQEMPILRAASMMWLKKIRRIPVTDGKKLVGIISMGDVHKAIFQNALV